MSSVRPQPAQPLTSEQITAYWHEQKKFPITRVSAEHEKFILEEKKLYHEAVTKAVEDEARNLSLAHYTFEDIAAIRKKYEGDKADLEKIKQIEKNTQVKAQELEQKFRADTEADYDYINEIEAEEKRRRQQGFIKAETEEKHATGFFGKLAAKMPKLPDWAKLLLHSVDDIVLAVAKNLPEEIMETGIGAIGILFAKGEIKEANKLFSRAIRGTGTYGQPEKLGSRVRDAALGALLGLFAVGRLALAVTLVATVAASVHLAATALFPPLMAASITLGTALLCWRQVDIYRNAKHRETAARADLLANIGIVGDLEFAKIHENKKIISLIDKVEKKQTLNTEERTTLRLYEAYAQARKARIEQKWKIPYKAVKIVCAGVILAGVILSGGLLGIGLIIGGVVAGIVAGKLEQGRKTKEHPAIHHIPVAPTAIPRSSSSASMGRRLSNGGPVVAPKAATKAPVKVKKPDVRSISPAAPIVSPDTDAFINRFRP